MTMAPPTETPPQETPPEQAPEQILDARLRPLPPEAGGPEAKPPEQKAPEETKPPESEQKAEGEQQSEAEKKLSPVDEAVAAALKAELTKTATALGIEGEFATAEELQAAIDKAETDSRDAALAQTTQEIIDEAYVKMFRALQGHKFKVLGEDGAEREVALTQEQIENAVGYNLLDVVDNLRQAEMEASFSELGMGIALLLPEASHPEFEKAVTEKGDDLNVKDWLSLAAEHLAPHTKAWKEREAAHSAALAKAKADGWEEAKNAPGGQVTQQGTQGRGSLTKEAWLAMSRDEQARVYRERPDEVEALR